MADVVLPSLGESVTEGIVTRWLKSVGDRVERDEPLYEISTDKVDSELPSPASGVLREILVAEGDTVPVGARVAVIDDGASPASAASTVLPPPATVPDPAASSMPPPPSPAPVPPSPAPTAQPSSSAPAGAASVSTVAPAAEGPVTSPVVRRILEDAGLDAAAVAGTGPGGTVTRRDAELAVLRRPSAEEVVQLGRGQQRMATHMAASVAASPHGFVAVEADASAIARARALGGVTRDGTVIEPWTVVAVAVVRALGEFELLNASVGDEGIVVHHTVNLGIVLGLDDGMLVPVIHAAAGLTLRALARRVADLKDRTTTRQLSTDDLEGATVTIAGAAGEHVLVSVPILIQPQVAIVSVGAPRRLAVPTDDGGVVAEERVVIGCSFDHRVVESLYVSRFLERVGELLAGLDVEGER